MLRAQYVEGIFVKSTYYFNRLHEDVPVYVSSVMNKFFNLIKWSDKKQYA